MIRSRVIAAGVSLALIAPVTAFLAPPAVQAMPASAPRGVGTDAGAFNPLLKPSTRTLSLAAGKSSTLVLPGVPQDAGGALIQVSVQAAQAASVTVSDAVRNAPARATIAAPQGGTVSASALVRTRSVVIKATNAVTVTVATLAWIVAPDENDDPLGPGGVGVAAPVTRLDTAKGFGDSWLTGAGRTVQLTGRGGIPATTANAVLAMVTLRPKANGITLTYGTGKATGSLQAGTANTVVSTLAYLPVNARGEVQVKTSSACGVAITTMGWVSTGDYLTRPVGDGGVMTVSPRRLATGTLPAKATLAPAEVPSGAGAVLLVNVQSTGTGRASVGSVSIESAGATSTGLIPAPVRGPRPTLVTSGSLTGLVNSVGWVRTSYVNESVNPTLTVNGGSKQTQSLGGDGEFVLTGTAADASGIEGVEVEIPDEGMRSANAKVDPITGVWSLPYAPPEGTWDVDVTAIDRAGNTTTSTVTITVKGADPDEMLVAPASVVLSGAQIEKVAALGDAGFSFTAPTLPFAVGDIVSVPPSGPAPDGAMRWILAVDPKPGGGWMVYTKQALVGDALRQANFGVTPEVLSGIENVSLRKMPRDFTINPQVTIPYSFTREGSDSWKNESGSVKANAWIKGTTGGAVIVRMQVFVETCFFVPCGGNVKFFQAQLTNTTRVDFTVHGEAGKSKNVVDDWNLSAPIDTGTYMAGPVPLATHLTPRGYIDLEAMLDINGYAQKYASLTVTYDEDHGGWQSPALDIGQPLDWHVAASFDGRAEAGVKLIEAIMIAGILGPTLIVRVGLLGVEGHASLVLDSKVSTPICDVNVKIYSVIGVGFGVEVVNPLGENKQYKIAEAAWPLVWAEWPQEDLCPDPPPTWWESAITEIMGRGVQADEITQRGDPLAWGFIDSQDLYGSLFATGDASLGRESVDTFADTDFGTLGSSILDRLADDSTFDAAITDFILTPEGKTLEIPYRFLSEEYGTDSGRPGKHDVAAILVNGKNCALTKDGRPVNAGTVNADSNASLYIDNTDPDSPGDVAYDGMTKLLLCKVTVTPRVPIPITIVVADLGKPGVDSALFIPTEGIRSY